MKKSIVLLIIFLCLQLIVGIYNAEAKKIIIRAAHNGSITFPYQTGLLKFKEVIESDTKGAVEVQIFPNGQLGTEEECAQMIKMGTLDININAAGGLAGFVKEIDLLNLPFLFRDLDHFYRVVDGPIGKRIAIAAEDKLDAVFLGYLYTGVRNAWGAKKPIRNINDLKGMKIRVMSSPVFVDTWNALGAQATPMAFGELYTALQQGVVDGAEMDVYDLIVDKFYEVIKHVSYTRHQFLASTVTFSKKRYDKLPPYVQIAVLKAAKDLVSAARKAQEGLSDKGADEAKKKGVNFYTVDVKSFQDKVHGVYEKHAENVGGIKVINMVVQE